MHSLSPDSSPRDLTRRALLKRSGAGLLGLSLLELAERTPLHAAAAPAPKAGPAAATAPAPLNRFSRDVQEYLVRRVREIERAADARRAALRTKGDAEAYVRDVRAKIQQCFGPFPARTPLNARVNGVLERDGYKIEKLIYESRPGFPVTANLYVPTGRTGRLPAVVGTCGHSDISKAAEPYQSFAQGLARQGYVVLLFDPPGQGERLQYVGADLKPRQGVGTSEHTHMGCQMALAGEFLGTWFAWDAMRGVDYLLTRPEVDPRHIGVTGNSGGGTQTTWLCALEPRFTMAAPSCFVTTWRRNLENELSADSEQIPPRVLALGLDHSDFIVAFAPKPVILMGQEKDYFDARGFEEAFGRIQRIYRLLGAEQNVQLFLGKDYHGYSQPNREAMYGWFNRQTKSASGSTEPKLTLEKEEALRCTERGQVGEMKPNTVHSIVRERAQQLRLARGSLGGDALRRAVTATLKLPPREGVPEYRILRPANNRNYPKRFAATYPVETEPGVHAIVYRLDDANLLSRVPRGAKRAVLYVSHRSADVELRSETLIKEVIAAERDAAVFACDTRGMGESEPALSSGVFSLRGGSDYFHASFGLMLDYPSVAQRTHDVLRVLDWLKGNGHDEVHLVARGYGAVPATFAAVLHPTVAQVTLKHALTSYQEVMDSEEYRWPFSLLLPGVLQAFDLPDCYRELAKKNLRQIEPVGAMGVPV